MSNLGYHYTSVDTLMKILDSIQDNNFLFHATSIFALNDPTEFEYGFEYIWKQLPCIEEELSLDNPQYQLSRLAEVLQMDSSKFKKEVLNLIKQSLYPPFVISYSNEKDFLPQWTLYGDDGRGVAIGLDVQNFIAKTTDDSGNTIIDSTRFKIEEPHAFRMSYGEMKDLCPAMMYIKYEYNEYYKKAVEGDFDTSIAQKQLKVLLDIIMIAAAYLKHRAYQYENESRLLCLKHPDQKIKYKTNSKGRLTPYIEQKIPIHYLKEVIFGPCCLDGLAINLKLTQCGLHWANTHSSEVPFR